MKHLPLIIVILILCGGIFLRFEQPQEWNKILDSLRADTGGEAPPQPNALVVAPQKPAGVEYITPDSTNYLNSGHVVDVPQPPHVPASTNPEPATNKVYAPPSPLPYQTAWVWNTSDGKIYHNVIIEKAEADRVSIFYDQGSAVIDMYKLTPDIQRLLNYDPDLAADALAARQKAGKNGAGSASP